MLYHKLIHQYACKEKYVTLLPIHAAVFYTRIVEGTFWAIMYAAHERELLSPTCLREHGARELAVNQSISTT